VRTARPPAWPTASSAATAKALGLTTLVALAGLTAAGASASESASRVRPALPQDQIEYWRRGVSSSRMGFEPFLMTLVRLKRGGLRKQLSPEPVGLSSTRLWARPVLETGRACGGGPPYVSDPKRRGYARVVRVRPGRKATPRR
jgi:hypothetical protein